MKINCQMTTDTGCKFIRKRIVLSIEKETQNTMLMNNRSYLFDIFTLHGAIEMTFFV